MRDCCGRPRRPMLLPQLSLPSVRPLRFLTSVGEARPVVRVRIRRIVVRIDVGDAAIRIRVIVRAEHNPGPPPTVSTCFFDSSAGMLRHRIGSACGRGRAGADAPCTPTAYDISMVPVKARRDPRLARAIAESLFAWTQATPPPVPALWHERNTTREALAPMYCASQ